MNGRTEISYNNDGMSEISSQKEREQKVDELLNRGVVEVADREHLRKRLLEPDTVLRVKFGIDPTGSRLHIGRGATLLKLKEFQDLGHQIVIIIGDGTAQVGDSSDKTGARKGLSPQQISENIKDYMSQFSRILDTSKLELVHNAEWLETISLPTLLKLTSCQTLQEASGRDNFAKRIKRGDSVSFTEAFYPLLQAYDSVMIKADVELGGTDQTYNLTKGRDVQKAFGMPPQDYITTQLLIGPDGEKMSTSKGNCIWINDKPEIKYVQLMKIADPLIPTYMECATRLPMDFVRKATKELEEGKADVMALKKVLAHEVVRLYDGEAAADNAADFFEKTVQKMEVPRSVLKRHLDPGEISIKTLIGLLVETNLAKSKADVKRLIEQNGLYIDGVAIDPKTENIRLNENSHFVIRLGKRSLKMLEITTQK
jgi:tyrosyl-tRNA synthetase